MTLPLTLKNKLFFKLWISMAHCIYLIRYSVNATTFRFAAWSRSWEIIRAFDKREWTKRLFITSFIIACILISLILTTIAL